MESRTMVLEKFNQPLVMKAFPIPNLREGEVLVKIEAAGVCGSDVHMWMGRDPRIRLPMILGDMADVNMRRALIRTAGDITPFFTRPISLVLLSLVLLTIISRMELFRKVLSAAMAGVKKRLKKRTD